MSEILHASCEIIFWHQAFPYIFFFFFKDFSITWFHWKGRFTESRDRKFFHPLVHSQGQAEAKSFLSLPDGYSGPSTWPFTTTFPGTLTGSRLGSRVAKTYINANIRCKHRLDLLSSNVCSHPCYLQCGDPSAVFNCATFPKSYVSWFKVPKRSGKGWDTWLHRVKEGIYSVNFRGTKGPQS